MNIWDGVSQRTVHCAGAAPEAITTSITLDWATVNLGTDSLSRYLELDARTNSVSVRVPSSPGIAHNGRKLKIAVNQNDSSTANFRGVVFTGGSPVERGILPIQPTYAMDRRSGHLVIEVINGQARINSGASFNQDPVLPNNASLLATLNSWTTGATWQVAPDNANEAFVQFNANGTFNPARAVNAWLVAAAGGGGGGGTVAGGGGAGEYFESQVFSITALNHAITIGAGGVGGLGWANTGSTGHGTDGSDTSFGALFTLNGGGGGGMHEGASFQNGNAGGSGGGGGQGTGTGGAATLTGPSAGHTPGRLGSVGGAAFTQAGGGGGGASGAGQAASSNNAGDGGAERFSLITGVSVGRCGGGGGGNRNDIDAGGPTGQGSTSGGRGGMDTLTPVAHDGVGAQSTGSVAAMNGRANSGGGAGGGGYSGASNSTIGATGGSGVIIIRVPLAAAVGL